MSTDTPPEARPLAPRLMIVGSPRSGTTFTQRLASEIAGVGIPPETHLLLWLERKDDLLYGAWPTDPAGQRAVVRQFARSPRMVDLGLGVDEVMEHADGRIDSPLVLFDAVLRTLTPGADVIGEKTPSHLLWWRALRDVRPDIRFVGMVRDPRAVVASQAELLREQSGRPDIDVALLARQTADDLVLLDELAADASGLLLHYEDVIADPDRARAALAAHIDLEGAGTERWDGPLHLANESWVERAAGPADPSRAERWREVLTLEEVVVVDSICGPRMHRFGYEVAGEVVDIPDDEVYRAHRTKQMQRVAAARLA